MKILFLFLIISFISGCSAGHDRTIRETLERYDADVWDYSYVVGDTIPGIILDSLKTVNHTSLSKRDKAYYNLLWTIANDRTNMNAESDSIICKAEDYYADSDDYRNYSRALLYKGIVRYRIDISDTTIHSYFKRAEQVFDQNQCQDKRLIALIYAYLGYINSTISNNEKSLEYSQKSLIQYINLNDTTNVILAQCDLRYLYLALDKMDDALSLSEELMKWEIDSPSVKQQINSVLFTYNKAVGELRKAELYAKYELEMAIPDYDKIPGYYKLADLYEKLSEKDSTLKYLSLLSSALSDTSHPNEYKYQKKICDIYSSLGYKEMAESHLEKAFYSLLDYHGESYSLAIRKLEKKYDVFKKDLEIRQIKQKYTISVLVLLLIVIVISFVVYMLIQRNKMIIRENETRQMTDSLVNKLLFVSCNTIPALYSFIDKTNLNKESACNIDALSSFNNYKRMKEQIEKQFRKDIGEVIKKDSALSSNADFQNLSPQEKIVCFLSEKGYSREEIASMLNTSVASIRASISRTGQKHKQQ